MIVKLTGDDLSFEQLYEVSLNGAEASLAAEARARMIASRAVIEKIVAAETTAYGVNTGFGDLAEVRISSDQIRTLQINLVRSHACGVGASLTEPETRAIILLRANALAKGLSGVRPVLVETLFAMLNRRVHPVIPSQGSVGASGDLAPLAHLALVLIGEGEAVLNGQRMAGGEALRKAGIAPLELEAKEGISLLNGTQGMLALLALALREAQILVDIPGARGDVTQSSSIESWKSDSRIASSNGS